MTKLNEYLKYNGNPSAARLCALWGLVSSAICSGIALIAWIWADNEPNWAIAMICAVPGLIGILPLIFQYLKSATESGKLETILKAIRNKE